MQSQVRSALCFPGQWEKISTTIIIHQISFEHFKQLVLRALELHSDNMHLSFLFLVTWIIFYMGFLKITGAQQIFQSVVSIRHSGRYRRTADPWFPLSSSIESIVMESRHWKTMSFAIIVSS